MIENDPDQDLVAAALSSAPVVEVPPSFLARVNARIDAEGEPDPGWLGLADFRTWTLRLVPAAAAMALIAALWSGGAADSAGSAGPSPSSSSSSSSAASSSSTVAQTFSPSSAADWQQDVSGNAMLEAALPGGSRVR